MATLLIIGGTGFFGKSTLDMFQRGRLSKWNIDRVIAMSRNSERLKIEEPSLVRGNVELFSSDISTADYLPNADYIIHAAASTDARNYLTAGQRERENIQKGAMNYCRLARKMSGNTKTLFVSSGAVYGWQPDIASSLDESCQLKNLDDIPESKRDYAVAKRDAEELIKNLGNEGVLVSIARCFAFVGKYLPRDQHFAIGNFIDNVLCREPVVVKAKHEVYRTYMYADDLVDWLMTLVDSASVLCPTYNVGSDDSVLLQDIAKRIAIKYGLTADVSDMTELKADRYVPDVSKAKNELGLRLSFNSYESVIKTIHDLSGVDC